MTVPLGARTGAPSSTQAPSTQEQSAIEAVELTKTYGTVRALDGLSFAVQPGTIFGLLGPNGAGKSTTVKILTTLTRPDSGAARVAGFDVRQRPDRVRRVIGVVSQGHGTDPQATGRENLLLAGRIHGMRGADVTRRAGELLERFGLAEAAGRVVRTYSGGMQRKLDVALGLMHRPRVLFLDEPTTGLDPAARAELWTQIQALAATGMSILLTTHYLEEADRLASRLAIVDRGRLVAQGSPEELKSELRGDAVVVELASPADALAARAALRRFDQGSTVDGRTVRARVANGAATVTPVVAALEAAGLVAASITVARPSLDDVYLLHTGRTFSAASARMEGAA
jgi:ABC-2 type transport system ATP-binding protein